ncbi:MAG: ABC transporter substrate-binding protein [Frankia sp.]|nr:ABC transporter substrate-binding protein [Frankia sp.]
MAACASAQTTDETGATGGCRAPGVSGDRIRLGLLYPDTGNAASLFGPFRAGVTARLGVANAEGGVHGRELEYTWRDDTSRPEANLVAARALVEQDEVFAILESTSAASGSAAYLHQRGVPVVGASVEEPWTVYDNMFSYSNLFSGTTAISTYGDFVASLGGQRAVVVYTSLSETSLAFARTLRESLQVAGIQVVESIDSTAPLNIPALGARIRATGADVLVGAVTGTTFGQVVLAALGAEVDLKVILSPAGYDERMLDLFKTVIAGTYFSVDFVPFEANLPAHQRYLDAMLRYAPETRPARQQAALIGWISADILIRGLEEAGPCPSQAGFIEALRSVSGYDADGLLPAPIDFRADFGQLTRCLTFVRVSADGTAFELVEPAPRCGEPVAVAGSPPDRASTSASAG